MNERIEQLAKQAGLMHILADHVKKYPGYQEPIEKFAELIVKECATAIINDRRLNDVRSAANGCVRIINEHFGVQ